MLDLNSIVENLDNPKNKNELTVFEIERDAYICKNFNLEVSFVILHNKSIEKWPRSRKTPSLFFSSGKKITLNNTDKNNSFEVVSPS